MPSDCTRAHVHTHTHALHPEVIRAGGGGGVYIPRQHLGRFVQVRVVLSPRWSPWSLGHPNSCCCCRGNYSSAMAPNNLFQGPRSPLKTAFTFSHLCAPSGGLRPRVHSPTLCWDPRSHRRCPWATPFQHLPQPLLLHHIGLHLGVLPGFLQP